MGQRPLVVVVGPTAVGKSRIAVEVAGQIDGEIISGDSMQVYRGMDIGAAKILPEEMVAFNGRSIPHHLLDILEPDEPFSVADFQAMARPLIKEIYTRGKVPMLVGGTGLYIQAVVDPYRFKEVSSDPILRKKLEAEEVEKGRGYLYRKLEAVDPVAARRIHPSNVRRVIRALEVYYLTGEPISTTWVVQRENPADGTATRMVGLTLPRDELYRRIDLRVEKMISDGLVEEVRGLLKRGYSPDLKSMQALGYRHITEYLKGQCDLEDAIKRLKRDTRHFAKRQYTWFLRDPRIKWYDVGKYRSLLKIASEIASDVAGQCQEA